ncbi:putative photosynthetic complex assembly protein PuhE [Ovoidimarina sediminis]|uniref:putative photosynthetic complex assembly protein PuhE n=1 Tax=Ovoidimarina sediminis TaxID=3079856 RepID=UPI002913D541|nr:putative photosynthetic complex assembly protein PuhE [Rhodophyticola sp. MJ-SS7]MDU8944491.1 putative photosynthetic complex assembly protein PuhE [Rhodophyticola sp. MJ-SS7]
MLASPWIAALIALFVWWFSTGAILWVVKGADGRGPGGHRWSVILSLPLFVAGVTGFAMTLAEPGIEGAYIAFLSALAIWGWIELAFLSGAITGPNAAPCPPGSQGWDRFMRAWGTIAYHEILLACALLAMVVPSMGAENQVALWTFGVLFFARVSAKLNLFLGVPRIHTEFLPRPLAHLPSHFRQSRLNALFPFSVTALAFTVACWLERIHAADSPAAAVAFALLAALTALALLEHWLMVLPLPDEKLWRWMIPAPKPNDKTLLREDANGL